MHTAAKKEGSKGRNAPSDGGGGQVEANKLVALLLRLTTAAIAIATAASLRASERQMAP